MATFRRQLSAEEVALIEHSETEAEAKPKPSAPAETEASKGDAKRKRRPPIRRENTFGTAEEDAFRRDFTINALFYDIATFSVIDYVGGMADLKAGVIRSIGDPNERFVETRSGWSGRFRSSHDSDSSSTLPSNERSGDTETRSQTPHPPG